MLDGATTNFTQTYKGTDPLQQPQLFIKAMGEKIERLPDIQLPFGAMRGMNRRRPPKERRTPGQGQRIAQTENGMIVG